MSNIIEDTEIDEIINPVGDIAYALAWVRTEAVLKPKGYWPEGDLKLGISPEDATVEFAGKRHTREELVDLVYEKHQTFFTEKASLYVTAEQSAGPLPGGPNLFP